MNTDLSQLFTFKMNKNSATSLYTCNIEEKLLTYYVTANHIKKN